MFSLKKSETSLELNSTYQKYVPIRSVLHRLKLLKSLIFFQFDYLTGMHFKCCLTIAAHSQRICFEILSQSERTCVTLFVEF